MFELVWPWLLLLLPLPLLVRWLLPPARAREPALRVPFYTSLAAASHSTSHSARGHLGHLLLLALAWLLLVLAATRPQWTGDPVPLPTAGRDLLLAVDISGSMGTRDMVLDGKAVDRLTVVKEVVSDFLLRRVGDRVGLILFGTQAYLQAPLTFDRNTVAQLLTDAPAGIAGGKTAIGDAIGLAVKRLQDRAEEHRVLVLLTDGANNIGAVEPLKAAELASAAGVRIYTVGVGNDEMRLRGVLGLPGRMVNPSADLDEDTLLAVAGMTGGRYFRARSSEDLVGIYAELDAIEPVAQDARSLRPVRALFHWPLAGALVLLLAAVSWRPRGRLEVSHA